jgi:hypothetical protein
MAGHASVATTARYDRRDHAVQQAPVDHNLIDRALARVDRCPQGIERFRLVPPDIPESVVELIIDRDFRRPPVSKES